MRWRTLYLETAAWEMEMPSFASSPCPSPRASPYRSFQCHRTSCNGAETRRVTTSVGTRELRVPRARVRDEETGETTEFRSELLPRYARRTRELDEAILGTYLSGANSRQSPVSDLGQECPGRRSERCSLWC